MKMKIIKNIKEVSEILPEDHQEEFKQICMQILRDMDKDGNGRRPEPKIIGGAYEVIICNDNDIVTEELANKYDTHPDLVRRQLDRVKEYSYKTPETKG